MAPHDDEDTFSDWGDLETLPDHALAELESNAIQFTQAQQPAQSVAPSSDYGDDFDDEDLDDNVVIDESKSTPALNSTFQPRRPTPSQFNRDRFPQRPAPSAIVYPPVQQRSYPQPPRFSQYQPPQPSLQQPARVNPQTQSQEPNDEQADLQRQIEEVHSQLSNGGKPMLMCEAH